MLALSVVSVERAEVICVCGVVGGEDRKIFYFIFFWCLLCVLCVLCVLCLLCLLCVLCVLCVLRVLSVGVVYGLVV